MTKGPVALVLAGVFFLVGLACGKESRTALLSLRWITGALIAVVLSLPWFVWMYYALGWHFVHQYALAGNLYYVTQPVSFSNRGRQSHPLCARHFSQASFRGASSWSAVRSTRSVAGVQESRLAPQEMLLWAWVGVVFIFFSLARFKVDRYVYPAAPACCLLAARAWLSVSVAAARSRRQRATTSAHAGPIALLGIVLVVVGIVRADSRCSISGLDLPRRDAR